ncbi:hypothetical protein L3Q82_014566 [Scortum barcoo]|uniref:Uncharacterized protein n=1 Tax=Scortum barcoo TaxID=214431 RepID=A0ACB8VXV1_9TELE|nr:hypothetical protein L3Q82_014566 [Scortum barcoo]
MGDPIQGRNAPDNIAPRIIQGTQTPPPHRDQLLALQERLAVLPEERPDVPRELKRRRRGRRAGVERRARRRCYRPVLPSIIMGNVRSLPNKMDELVALTRHQRENRECSLLLFTETWLTALTPDTAVVPPLC